MSLVENTYTAGEAYDDYSGTDKVSEFGGELSLWGNEWTTEKLNDPSFQVIFDADVGAGILRVDNISVEVFYRLPFGVAAPAGDPILDEFGDPTYNADGSQAFDTDGFPGYRNSPTLAGCIARGPSGGPRFVVVGSGGSIKTSDDGGDSWQEKDSGISSTLNDVDSNGSLILAAGNNGEVVSSVDGDSWAREDSLTTEPLFFVGVDRYRNELVAGGQSGAIRRLISGSWRADRN
jgi:hypothetical protein